MQPFVLELQIEYRTCSQLQQLDLYLSNSFEINGDAELRFNLLLYLTYEQLEDFFIELFRESSHLRCCVGRPEMEKLKSLTKLVGVWTSTKLQNSSPKRILFEGIVPYNRYNLEIFLKYF